MLLLHVLANVLYSFISVQETTMTKCDSECANGAGSSTPLLFVCIRRAIDKVLSTNTCLRVSYQRRHKSACAAPAGSYRLVISELLLKRLCNLAKSRSADQPAL